jgi:xanthine dehydrogenase small subunit
MVQFILNNEMITTKVEKGTTVLDFVRYHQHLRGTKIGCREGDCGACTVLVGTLDGNKVSYQTMTCCLMPLANAYGKHIVTIEGINTDKLNPAQQAMVEEGGTQCGFCTVGFIVSMTGFCMEADQATYKEAVASVDGNICRCTGYKSIERACARMVKSMKNKDAKSPVEWLIKKGHLPPYFSTIASRIKKIKKIKSASKKNNIPVGGGTDLYVQRPEEMIDKAAVHLFDKKKYKDIKSKGNYIYIGAEATATDILQSPLIQKHFPSLDEDMKLVSSTPIRNMGTIAGNFVNASPIGDLTIYFLALDSDVVLERNGKERIVPLNKFYLGYKKLDKKSNEVVRWIRFKKPTKTQLYNFEKVCKRTHLDIASVNSAALISKKGNKIIEAHISIGGVGPIPTYLFKTCQFLKGKTITPEIVEQAHQVLAKEISPISDARGSADYKRLLARQLFFAHFIELFPAKFSLTSLMLTH